MTERVPISKKLRFEIFKRDGFVCQYCGGHPPDVVLHVDHIKPVVEGGTNDEHNLVTSCGPCNLGKGARSLTEIPQSLEERARETAEREEQVRGYHEVMESRRRRLDEQTWEILDELIAHASKDGVPRDWFFSTKRFIDRIGYHATLEFAEIAVGRCRSEERLDRFRYFCKCCWNKIREGGQLH